MPEEDDSACSCLLLRRPVREARRRGPGACLNLCGGRAEGEVVRRRPLRRRMTTTQSLTQATLFPQKTTPCAGHAWHMPTHAHTAKGLGNEEGGQEHTANCSHSLTKLNQRLQGGRVPPVPQRLPTARIPRPHAWGSQQSGPRPKGGAVREEWRDE